MRLAVAAERSWGIPSRQLERFASCALRSLGRATADVTIVLAGSRTSQRLNRRYRGQRRPTNVLAFPLQGSGNRPLKLLGELYLCVPVIRAEARRFGLTQDQHLTRLVAHGLLHLIGHDHRTRSGQRRMERLERRLIGRCAPKATA